MSWPFARMRQRTGSANVNLLRQANAPFPFASHGIASRRVDTALSMTFTASSCHALPKLSRRLTSNERTSPAMYLEVFGAKTALCRGLNCDGSTSNRKLVHGRHGTSSGHSFCAGKRACSR
eukprot:3686426-Rhodomonas_salina.1